jgi:hypothetical protein
MEVLLFVILVLLAGIYDHVACQAGHVAPPQPGALLPGPLALGLFLLGVLGCLALLAAATGGLT